MFTFSRIHTKTTPQNGRDATLDIFRALAILSVILFHYTARLPREEFGVNESIVPSFNFGWIGVYFFFIISGYCIFYTLEREPTIWRFFAKRISRIYPAFAAAAILLFAVDQVFPLPLLQEYNFREAAPSFLDLLGNLAMMGGVFEWVNGSFWSITVEIQFYILIGLFAMAFKNGKRLTSYFSAVAVLLGCFWLLSFWGGMIFEPLDKISKALRLLVIAPYLPFFALGIIGAQLAKQRSTFRPLFKRQLLLASMIVFSQSMVEAPYLLSNQVLLPIAGLIGLALMFRAYCGGWRLPHISFVTPSLTQIGLLSYSWYLLHENLGYLILNALNPALPHWLSVLVAIGVTYALAHAFSWAFEWRFRKGAEQFAEWMLTRIGLLLPKRLGEGMA